MHIFRSLLFLGQGIAFTNAAIPRALCAADNCARAVTGTAKGTAYQATAKRDCSSFLLVSVIPPTTTLTDLTTIFPSTITETSTTLVVSTTSTVFPFTSQVTTTVTTDSQTVISTIISTTTLTTITTTTPAAVNARAVAADTSRTVSPTQVPAYASPCSGSARYSSACSCLGVTLSTTTLETPTTRTVATITGTASTTQSVAFTTTVTLSLTTTIVVSVSDTVTATTSTSTTTTTTFTSTETACVPTVPAGNILVNPGFNDGTFNGWNPGGYGGFANSIGDDAQCGLFGAQMTVSASSSYGRIGQRFVGLDTGKNYQIQTYAKLVSGDGSNCFYYLSCQQPGSSSSAGNRRLDTPLSSIPAAWTRYSLLCPPGVNQLTMSITIQCNQGTGPVTIGIDETAMYPITIVAPQ